MRSALVVTGLVLSLTLTGAAPIQSGQKPEAMRGDELYAVYVAQGQPVLTGAFPTVQRFKSFGSDFRNRVLTLWEREPPTRLRAMFMLDISVVALDHHYDDWLDFIHHAGKYLRRRVEPRGANPGADAFELLWYQTAVAMISGQRRPDFLADEGVGPLKGRVVPDPPADPAAAVLVDPWILLARGFSEEAFVIDDQAVIDRRGPQALGWYEAAGRYDSTRAEAAVRSAWLLIAMRRSADALSVLDRFEDGWTTDDVLRYWKQLLRGKALAALDRADEARAAYQAALAIVPRAQSPRVALMSMALKDGRPDLAESIAVAIRTEAEPAIDPWWSYPHGDLRFFPARLQALRAMSRQ